MNSSRRKKNSECLVRADPEGHGPYVSEETSPAIDDILWSVGNNLAASHRDQSGRRGQLHTFKTAKYEMGMCVCARVHVWACTYGWYIVWELTLIQMISWCWIRGHLLFAAESCWTTVSYVNWPFVQCAKWNQHIQGCTYRARTIKCSSLLYQQTVYIIRMSQRH